MKSTQGVVDIRGKQYQTVSLRIHEFRLKHPIDDGWGLITELVECSEAQVICRASVVSPEGKTVATGYAQERWTGQINKTSAVENCETSAWGRALSAAGLGGEKFPVASAEEMQQALSQQSNKPQVSIKEHIWGCNDPESLYQLVGKWEEKRPIENNHENWAGIAAFARARMAETGWEYHESLDKFLTMVEKATEVQDESA